MSSQSDKSRQSAFSADSHMQIGTLSQTTPESFEEPKSPQNKTSNKQKITKKPRKKSKLKQKKHKRLQTQNTDDMDDTNTTETVQLAKNKRLWQNQKQRKIVDQPILNKGSKIKHHFKVHWKKEERELFLRAIAKFGCGIEKLMKLFPNQTRIKLLQRLCNIRKEVIQFPGKYDKAIEDQIMDCAIQKKWNIKEHQQFIDAIQIYGKNYAKLAEVIPNKSVAQIATYAVKQVRRIQKKPIHHPDRLILPMIREKCLVDQETQAMKVLKTQMQDVIGEATMWATLNPDLCITNKKMELKIEDEVKTKEIQSNLKIQ